MIDSPKQQRMQKQDNEWPYTLTAQNWTVDICPRFRFFLGVDHPADACKFSRVMVSVNALRQRRGSFGVGKWIMDSGAFSELSLHGKYRFSPSEYAAQIRRWWVCGKLLAAVTQDYMCEPFILGRTGLDVDKHQRLTIERFDVIRQEASSAAYIMPVLQGFRPHEYARHVALYGDRLAQGDWVGVGSVCKRNGKPSEVASVLCAIHDVRPDLRLHGFGLKLTALRCRAVLEQLASSDSMAWQFNERAAGRPAHALSAARRYIERVEIATGVFVPP